jgi:hypothetical protein
MRALSLAASMAIGGAAAAPSDPSAAAAIPAFSNAKPAPGLPPRWRPLVPAGVKPPAFDQVEDAGATVLRVHSQGEAGAAAYALHADLGRTPILSWRWKVDRVVERADLATKAGDDFAARVYVFFDVPSSELPVGDRIRLALARLLHGEQLPSTAICYVWDNRHPVGTTAWSAYTDRVRMVVLESGDERAGHWVGERRDLAADYRAAFGAHAPVAPVSGIAVGNDTDQTGESATAWFGDLALAAGSAP